MFPGRYFGARFFAPRYFPKVGVTIVFDPQWAVNSNTCLGPAVTQPVTK